MTQNAEVLERLRIALDRLGFTQRLSVESVPLVQQLIDDIIAKDAIIRYEYAFICKY